VFDTAISRRHDLHSKLVNAGDTCLLGCKF